MISSTSCPIEITIDDDTEEFEGHPNSTLEIGPTINSRNWSSEKIESPNNGRVQKEDSKDFCCTIPDIQSRENNLADTKIIEKAIIENFISCPSAQMVVKFKRTMMPQPYRSTV